MSTYRDGEQFEEQRHDGLICTEQTYETDQIRQGGRAGLTILILINLYFDKPISVFKS